MDIKLIEEAQEIVNCIRGNCPKDHDGICLYDYDESFSERDARAAKPMQIALLKARIDEADGFAHGGDDWTSNGEDVNGEAPSSYDRCEQMRAEITKLEAEIKG